MEIRILIIISTFILFSQFIKLYNKKLIKMHNEYYPCYDIMNQKIASILGFKMCIWNFMHIVIYCLLCVLLKAELNPKKHIIVFMIGLLWLIMAPYKEKNNKHEKCDGTVYQDIFIPRTDDLFFNTTGQVVYILLYKWNIVQKIIKFICNLV